MSEYDYTKWADADLLSMERTLAFHCAAYKSVNPRQAEYEKQLEEIRRELIRRGLAKF